MNRATTRDMTDPLHAYPLGGVDARHRPTFRYLDLLTADGRRDFDRHNLLSNAYRSELQAILDAAARYPHPTHHLLVDLVAVVSHQLALRKAYGVTR